MRVDFYQLSRDPVEKVVATLARKVLDSGARLLVVSEDESDLKKISTALWSAPGEAFLANGVSTAPYAERQPILLASDIVPETDRTMAILADGKWREGAENFERVLLIFDESATGAARELWRGFDAKEDGGEAADRHIFKQSPEGRWAEGG